MQIDSAGIHFLEELISNELMNGLRKNCAISTLNTFFYKTLTFLATGNTQLCNGDSIGVSQPPFLGQILLLLNVSFLHKFVLSLFNFHIMFGKFAKILSCWVSWNCWGYRWHTCTYHRSFLIRKRQQTSLPRHQHIARLWSIR